MAMTQRRIQLLRLLAEIDQQIREAEMLAGDDMSDDVDRRFAAVQFEFRRQALERVETLLTVGKEL